MTKAKAGPTPTLAILWLADAFDGRDCPLCGGPGYMPDGGTYPVLVALREGAPKPVCPKCGATLAPELYRVLTDHLAYRGAVDHVALVPDKIACARLMLRLCGEGQATDGDVLRLALANGLNALLRKILPERLARALPEVVCTAAEAASDAEELPF